MAEQEWQGITALRFVLESLGLNVNREFIQHVVDIVEEELARLADEEEAWSQAQHDKYYGPRGPMGPVLS